MNKPVQLKLGNIIVFGLLLVSVVCFSLAGCNLGKHEVSKTLVSTSIMADVVQSVPSAPKAEPAKAPSTEQVEVVTLTDGNMVILDSEFTDESVTAVMQDLKRISDKMPSSGTIYLVINSPGGSVSSGQMLVSFIKALPQKVKTITIFAASMGFQTVQQLDERLILDSGTLMNHRVRFGVSGQAPGEIYSRLKWIMSMTDALDATAANRMHLSFSEYRDLVHDEYWTFGRNAVKEKAADRMVYAKCGKGLDGTRETEVQTMFGPFKVTVSKCPLMPGILSIKASSDVKPENLNKGIEYVREMYTDRTSFVRDFILTSKSTR